MLSLLRGQALKVVSAVALASTASSVGLYFLWQGARTDVALANAQAEIEILEGNVVTEQLRSQALSDLVAQMEERELQFERLVDDAIQRSEESRERASDFRQLLIEERANNEVYVEWADSDIPVSTIDRLRNLASGGTGSASRDPESGDSSSPSGPDGSLQTP